MTTDGCEDAGMTRTDPASVPTSARAGRTSISIRRLLEGLNWAPAQIGSPPPPGAGHRPGWGGAIGVLLSGLIHLKLWINGGYQGISVIGPLFLAQGIVGILLAAALGIFRRLWLVLVGAGDWVSTAGGLP